MERKKRLQVLGLLKWIEWGNFPLYSGLFDQWTEKVNYLLKETEEYQDQSKDILNLILPSEDILSDSDSEEPVEESWDFDFCNEIKVS